MLWRAFMCGGGGGGMCVCVCVGGGGVYHIYVRLYNDKTVASHNLIEKCECCDPDTIIPTSGFMLNCE